MTVYLAPNFHFDLTWHKNVATFMRISADIFKEALDLLDSDDAFRFTIDHVAFIEWFLKTYPGERTRIDRHIAGGRLAIVGGMVSMMDCDVPDGEAFARQLLYGQRWLGANLGVRARTGWLIDNYGYTPQLPQLLRLAGIDALEICLWWAPPGYLQRHLPWSEFRWRGLDGSEVLVHVALPNYTGPLFPGHRTYDDPPAAFTAGDERALAKVALETWIGRVAPFATGAELLGHVGGDFRHPTPRLTAYVDWWNAGEAGHRVELATPGDFFSVLAHRLETLPVLDGEISPPMHTVVKTLPELQQIAQSPEHVRAEGVGRFGEGYAEAKVERKQQDRAVHLALREAEQAATWAALTGGDDADERERVASRIAALYHPILTFGHHDPFIGCVVNEDYEKIMALLADTLDEAWVLRDQALARLAQLTNVRPPFAPLAGSWQVFNFLPKTQTGVVELSVDPALDPHDLEAVDSAGARLPMQVVEAADAPSGGGPRKSLLTCVDMPACGHEVIHLVPARPFGLPAAPGSGARGGATKQAGGRPAPAHAGAVLENSRYRLSFSPSGALASIHDAATGQELLGAGGAEFVVEEDLGCFCHIDPTGVAWRQSEYPLAKIEALENGPVRWRVRIENESKGMRYRQEVSIYEALPWIEFRLSMDIRSGEDLRSRVAIDLPGAPAEVWAETAFGAVRRGAELAHTVNWTDCTGAGWGLASLNEGLTGYEVAGSTLYLSLWRGLSLFNDCYGCLQREQRAPLVERGLRNFRFALLPHEGDWRSANLVHLGQAFNAPLRALPVEPHDGELPARRQWLSAQPDGVRLAAVKPAEQGDGLVLRLYEAHGTATSALLQIPEGFSHWCETNLLEEPTSPLQGVTGEVALTFRPYEIKTVMLIR